MKDKTLFMYNIRVADQAKKDYLFNRKYTVLNITGYGVTA